MDPAEYDRQGRYMRSARCAVCVTLALIIIVPATLIVGSIGYRWTYGYFAAAIADHSERVDAASLLAKSSLCMDVSQRSRISRIVDCDYSDRLAAQRPDDLAWVDMMNYLNVCRDGVCMWGGIDLADKLFLPLVSWTSRLVAVLVLVLSVVLCQLLTVRRHGHECMPMTAGGAWVQAAPDATKLITLNVDDSQAMREFLERRKKTS